MLFFRHIYACVIVVLFCNLLARLSAVVDKHNDDDAPTTIVFNDDSQHRSYKKSLKQMPKTSATSTTTSGAGGDAEATTTTNAARADELVTADEALNPGDIVAATEHQPRDQAVNRLVDVCRFVFVFLCLQHIAFFFFFYSTLFVFCRRCIHAR
jgi:uncharacterized membrane protein YhiD involved in acid resistance